MKFSGLCECIDSPPGTNFIKGYVYHWSIAIDCRVVYKDDGGKIVLGDIAFLWYFKEL